MWQFIFYENIAPGERKIFMDTFFIVKGMEKKIRRNWSWQFKNVIAATIQTFFVCMCLIKNNEIKLNVYKNSLTHTYKKKRTLGNIYFQGLLFVSFHKSNKK